MFATEVDIQKFKILEQVTRGSESYSSKVVYGQDGENFILQTPTLSCTFGLSGYQYPGNKEIKYSINLTLDPNTTGVKEMRELINNVDEMTKETVRDEYKEDLDKLTFFSIIKIPKDPKYFPSIRCKMVSNAQYFKCKIYKEGKPVSQKISEVQKLIKKGTRMEVKLQLNPIWRMKGKYGVSWQIRGINLVEEDFPFR